MSREISITNAKKVDGKVAFDWPKSRPAVRMVAPTGAAARYEHLIKAPEGVALKKLLENAGGDNERLAQALVAGDPEIDLRVAGRRLGDAMRVYVRKDGSILHAARVLQVVYGTDGLEKARTDFVDAESNVTEEDPPIAWTGRLMPVDDVVRKYAFTQKIQLRHVNGLTFDFLYDMAKTLHEAAAVLLVGAGPKGAAPLIFKRNGAPYRGFLEGRIEGEAYRLVMHLSNVELKSVLPPE